MGQAWKAWCVALTTSDALHDLLLVQAMRVSVDNASTTRLRRFVACADGAAKHAGGSGDPTGAVAACLIAMSG